MTSSDLTTLAAVKAWLSITSDTTDAQIGGLITSVSRAIYSAMQRPNILPMTYSEAIAGNHADKITLRNWPVNSILSMVVGTQTIVASPGFDQPGYVIETVDPAPPSRPAVIHRRGGHFWGRFASIAVTYKAGYQVTETLTVAGGAATATAPYGAWASDQGVTYAATGIALSAVAGSPAQGQYSVAAGDYTFNAADDGAGVVVSYGFIPADLAQSAIEWTAQRFKAQSNIGLRSKSLGGQETISYDTGAMPAAVTAMIQPYKRVVAS